MRRFTVWARIEVMDSEYSSRPHSLTDDVIFLETDSLQRAEAFLRELCGPYIEFSVKHDYRCYCPKCGQTWEVHSDVGRCVEDQGPNERLDKAIALLEGIKV